MLSEQTGTFLVCDDEFRDWYRVLRQTAALKSVEPQYVTPDILGPNGLPCGWQVRAHVCIPSGQGHPAVVCLVSRTDGGWLLVEQESGEYRTTTMRLHAETLARLHAGVCTYRDDPARAARQWKPTEEMVTMFLVTFYDLNDPEEAAEQVLVGLGARPSRLPAALP